jgi:hypothetical protein
MTIRDMSTAPPASDPAPSSIPALERATVTRRVTAWDVVGVLALVCTMLAVERASVVLLDTPLGRSQGIRSVTLACWVLFLAGLGVLLVRNRPKLADIPRRLTAVWIDPPGAWAAFLLGAILALPVIALYWPVLFYDSDSARIVAAIRHVQRGGGLGFFTETQEPFLPHILLGPAIALRGVAAAKVLAIVSVQVLVGVVSYIAYQVTHRMFAAAAAAAALLGISPIFERAVSLPMYPTALALGYFGGWLGYRAMRGGDGVAWRFVVPAGVCLALAPEAQGTGQLFFAVPALLVILAPSVRSGVRTAAALYGVVLVASIPRVVINLWEGGLSYATSPRADYWITKGYLLEIQRDFWEYPGISESVPEFVAKLPARFMDFLGAQAWVVVILACVGWVACGRSRARWFVAATTGFLLAAVTIKRIPPFPRYYAPFWPGLAILAAVGVVWLVQRRTDARRMAWALSALALAIVAGIGFQDGLREVDATRREVDALPLRSYAGAIDDGKGVIGTRAHQGLAGIDADIATWGDQFLTEEEYVAFLTWPSDQAVIEVMQRHDIAWVFIDRRRLLEGPYNDTWLLPHYGRHSRHVQRIGHSPNFCRWIGAPGDFVLFRLGPCPSD